MNYNTIFKKTTRRSYTVLDNAALRDPSLSWKATGLLAYLLSLPDDWTVNRSDLVERKTDGRDSLDSGLNELEEAGYLRRYWLKNEGKFAAHVIEVRESLEIPWPGEPETENPETGNPETENPSLLSTNNNQLLIEPITNQNNGEVSASVQTVWDAFLTSTGRKASQYKLTLKRRRLIERALKSYSVDDVVKAVTGWEHSSFHRGENDDRKVYNSLELFLRNDEKIEQFISYHSIAPVPGANADWDTDRVNPFTRKIKEVNV